MSNAPACGAGRTRLLVLTDISSNRTGYMEPDDTQSLVRLLLYANDFDIEGLIATYTKHWSDSKPEYIAEVVRAYGHVRDNLALHDPRYPSADDLMRVVKRGNPQDGLDQVGEGCDTEASEWIVARGEAEDDRPLWITVWGGTTDLAQALWRAERTRSADEMARFVARLRVYAIGDQYGIGSWIRDRFPDLFYIVPRHAYRGMYKGGDPSLVSWDWVESRITGGRGALGEAYPNYDGGDLWGAVKGVKEGDTPSFLYLVPNGLGDPERPELGSWGGRFAAKTNQPKHYADAADESGDGEDDTGERVTVSRWRAAYQDAFAARMEWCVLPPERTAREPVAVIDGGGVRRVSPGGTVELSAESSLDPGGGGLNFRWFVYREAGTYAGEVRIEGSGRPRATVTIPESECAGEIHVILEAATRRTPALTSYRRVIIEVGRGTEIGG